ncbi:hypothetical protein JW835_15895 [bacterium]|nr:hypothetical protein [bacterium]
MLVHFTRSKMTRTALSAFTALSIFWVSHIRAEEKDQLSYPELGITTSLLIIHPSIGYWWGRTGLRFTGMYLKKDHHEFHLNIGYGLYDSEKVQHSINLLTSWVAGSDPGADYKYGATGIAYSINYKGFFLEIGLSRPWRDDVGNLAHDPVVPSGYWGYIHRFRNE